MMLYAFKLTPFRVVLMMIALIVIPCNAEALAVIPAEESLVKFSISGADEAPRRLDRSERSVANSTRFKLQSGHYELGWRVQE